MVKEIKAFKLPFFKNNDANGGAMATAIKQCPQDHVVVKSWTADKGQLWGSVSTTQYLKLLEKNNGIYEVLHKYPHKLYFDIDRHLDGTETDTDTYLDDCITNIKAYFPEGNFAVSGSVTEKKQSYHVISDSYIIHNADERAVVKIIVKKLGYDTKVYGANQNMKSVNQSKMDGRVQGLITNDNIKAHSINCFLTDYPAPIAHSFPTDVKEEILIEKSIKKFDIGVLPKINMPVPEKINWERITALQVLELLPCTKDFSFEYSHKVARYCYANEITLPFFHSWIKQKRPVMTAEFIKKWEYHWANLHKFPPCSVESMKPILAYYYPDIMKNIHFRKFKNLFYLPDDIKKTKIERLDVTHYRSVYTLNQYRHRE